MVILFEILCVLALVGFCVVVWWPAALLVVAAAAALIAWNKQREEKR